jgi:hypothetical protein
MPKVNKLSKKETQLVLLFRGIDSKHERQTFMLLMASMATGRLTKMADKKSVRSLLQNVW